MNKDEKKEAIYRAVLRKQLYMQCTIHFKGFVFPFWQVRKEKST